MVGEGQARAVLEHQRVAEERAQATSGHWMKPLIFGMRAIAMATGDERCASVVAMAN